MKKLIYLTAMFVALSMFTSCDKEEDINKSELPSSSREFLDTHFAGVDIIRIQKETDGFEKDYTVYLANGFTVDFRKSGSWDEVNGHINVLPQSVLNLLPAGIAQYVNTNFPDYFIVKVSKEHSPSGYDIELNNSMGLEFDSNGNIRGFDD